MTWLTPHQSDSLESPRSLTYANNKDCQVSRRNSPFLFSIAIVSAYSEVKHTCVGQLGPRSAQNTQYSICGCRCNDLRWKADAPAQVLRFESWFEVLGKQCLDSAADPPPATPFCFRSNSCEHRPRSFIVSRAAVKRASKYIHVKVHQAWWHPYLLSCQSTCRGNTRPLQPELRSSLLK